MSGSDHRLNALRALLLLAILAVTALVLAACGKNPTKPKPPGGGGFQYLDPVSPRNVLQNLVSAYNRRDSVETRVVYDIQYQGTSADPSQPIPFYTFMQGTEISHVRRLHDDPNIVSVALDLGQPSTWQVLPGLATDPPGSVVIPIQYAVISIQDVTSSSYVFKPVTMEYAFKPTVAAPGDTTWTVIRWTEIAN